MQYIEQMKENEAIEDLAKYIERHILGGGMDSLTRAAIRQALFLAVSYGKDKNMMKDEKNEIE